MIVWAEIPYISQHLKNGKENTISQMKELIIQNYNHPSIVVWGLSNEITMKGPSDEELLENHRVLNDMVHEMDHYKTDYNGMCFDVQYRRSIYTDSGYRVLQSLFWLVRRNDGHEWTMV